MIDLFGRREIAYLRGLLVRRDEDFQIERHDRDKARAERDAALAKVTELERRLQIAESDLAGERHQREHARTFDAAREARLRAAVSALLDVVECRDVAVPEPKPKPKTPVTAWLDHHFGGGR